MPCSAVTRRAVRIHHSGHSGYGVGGPEDGTVAGAGGVVDGEPPRVGEPVGVGELVGVGEWLGVRDGVGDCVGLEKDRVGLRVAEGLTTGWVTPAGTGTGTGRTRM
jgi:hypothetical protein